MADPIADNADLAVDELKRKARRRLIGAIVLALAAATILPLLLEQEQKPLGDDVSVQIPPVDNSKFVNRLGGGKAKDALPGAKADPVAAPAPRPAPETPPPASPAAPPAPAVAAAPPPSAIAAAPPPSAVTVAPPPSAVAAAPPPPAAAASPAPAPPEARPTTGAQAAEPANSEGFVVQLGAFTDNYGANALANKLKKIGYPAYTESVETSRGTLWRVRVGRYPSREAAVEARAKLKADGHNGMVAAAK